MKDEIGSRTTRWDNIESARADIDDYINYYNNDRYQWQLGKLTPSEYYTYSTIGQKPASVDQ